MTRREKGYLREQDSPKESQERRSCKAEREGCEQRGRGSAFFGERERDGEQGDKSYLPREGKHCRRSRPAPARFGLLVLMLVAVALDVLLAPLPPEEEPPAAPEDRPEFSALVPLAICAYSLLSFAFRTVFTPSAGISIATTSFAHEHLAKNEVLEELAGRNERLGNQERRSCKAEREGCRRQTSYAKVRCCAAWGKPRQC